MTETRHRSMKADTYSTQYPFAAAPDIIRSNQKDTYFQSLLIDSLSAVLRSIYGARFVHRYASEARMVADLLYLGFTTLIGNRTLGEEYCDIVQVESNTLKLPSIVRRAGYILTSVLLPYVLNKGLPELRARLRRWLQAFPRPPEDEARSLQASTKLRNYLLQNLSTATSPASIYAVGLTVFYFSGAYYHISKRVWGLRYLFSKRVEPSEQRIGYEVLGVLLVLQLGVQAWLHVQNTYNSEHPSLANQESLSGGNAVLSGGVEVGLRASRADDILLEQVHVSTNREDLGTRILTPTLTVPRYNLEESSMMSWIEGQQQRKCTLCLEELKDPSVTTCGHVFCWACVLDWIKEKPECPLCRQSIIMQHVLPLRE